MRECKVSHVAVWMLALSMSASGVVAQPVGPRLAETSSVVEHGPHSGEDRAELTAASLRSMILENGLVQNTGWSKAEKRAQRSVGFRRISDSPWCRTVA